MTPVTCPGCTLAFDSPVGEAICSSCGRVFEVRPPEPLSIRFALGLIFVGLALIPLVVSLVIGRDDLQARYRRTLEANPEVVARIADSQFETLQELISQFPESRLEGAHLPVGSRVHWIYASISIGGFLLLTVLLIPKGNSGRVWPFGVALFTGTIGIGLLLLFQLFAELSQGVISSNPVFLIIRAIGQSYRAAQDPGTGFLMSLAGFTFGVGLCEELLKAVPIYWHFRRKAWLDWRGALMWGVASGVGFGVTEGIFYSADFYNGMAGGNLYVIRFVSCVTLHAIWSAAVALAIWEDQEAIFQADSWLEILGTLPGVLFIPMLLHALYDTFLKRGPDWAAALVALMSVAWLVRRVMLARARESAELATVSS